MKYLKVLQPSLPVGVTVSSTSWMVNDKSDFTGTEILNAPNDAVDLFSKKLTTEMSESDVWYAKVIMHLSNGLNEESNIITLGKNVDNKPHQLYVYPPIIYHKMTLGAFPKMTVSISAPKFYYDVSAHTSTTWKLKDTAGVTFYEREYDVDNLLQLTIPEQAYESVDAFMIEVSYNFDKNDIDVVGRETIVRNIKGGELTLSKKVLDAGVDNELQVLGFDLALTTAVVTYQINDVMSDPIYIIPSHSDKFTIPANELNDTKEVTVYLSSGGYNNEGVTEIVLEVTDTDMVLSYLSENAKISTITNKNFTGVDVLPIALSESKFVLKDAGDDKVYRVTSKTLRNLSTQTSVQDYTTLLPNGKLISFNADIFSLVSLADTLTINTTIINPVINVTGDSGMYFNGDNLHILNGITDKSINVTIAQYDPLTDIATTDIQKFIINNTTTFVANAVGVFQFTGKSPITLPDTYDKFKYIQSDTGVFMIAMKDNYTTINIYHLTPTEVILKSELTLPSLLGIPVITYDALDDRIVIVHKI